MPEAGVHIDHARRQLGDRGERVAVIVEVCTPVHVFEAKAAVQIATARHHHTLFERKGVQRSCCHGRHSI